MRSAFRQQHVGSRLGGVNSASTVRQKGRELSSRVVHILSCNYLLFWGDNSRELAGHQKTLVDTLERQQHELNDLRAQRVPIPPTASQSVAAANEDRFGAMGETSPFTSGQDPPIQLPVNAQQGAGGLASAMPNTAVNASSSTGHGVKIVLPDGTEIPLGGQSNAAGPKVPGSTQLDALQRSDKWLPSMPVVESNRWKSRMEEILGMEQWLDSFCNWLSLISEPFCPHRSEVFCDFSAAN